MRLYWEIGKLSFQRQLAYRTANYAGLVTNLFFGILRAAILVALYQGQQEISGITLRDAVTYTGLTQAIIAYLHLFGVNHGIMNSVYSGEVSADLLKPLNYFSFWMAKDFGGSVVSLLIRGLVIMGAYSLFFPITLPSGFLQWSAFIVSLLLAWMVNFAFRFWVNLSAFWVPNAQGIGRLAFTLSWFLCGFVYPLRFFPDWFSRLCHYTPFPSIVNTTVEIYLGVMTGPAILQGLLVQLFWFLALFAAGQATLRAGVRRLVILGG